MGITANPVAFSLLCNKVQDGDRKLPLLPAVCSGFPNNVITDTRMLGKKTGLFYCGLAKRDYMCTAPSRSACRGHMSHQQLGLLTASSARTLLQCPKQQLMPLFLYCYAPQKDLCSREEGAAVNIELDNSNGNQSVTLQQARRQLPHLLPYTLKTTPDSRDVPLHNALQAQSCACPQLCLVKETCAS